MALRRIAFGAATLSAARIFQLASSFVAIPFLARILTPTDFGLVALAMSMVMFFTYFADAGLGRSLVRIDAADKEAWSTGHWAVVMMGFAMALVLYAIAEPAGRLLDEPRVAPLLRVLAAAPILLSFVEIPAATLLQRERFHWLAGGEFFGAIAGIIVALSVALAGGGAWALIWQQLTQRIVKLLVIWPASRFAPRLVFKPRRLLEHLRFARDTVGWSLMTWISRQADTMIVGKFLGAATLGLYNIAVRVMQLPVNIFGASLNNALYPRLVRLREDHASLREIVMSATLAQAAFVFPPIAAIAASSDAFFKLLLSERWQGADIIFTLLAPAAAIQTIVILNGSLLQAVQRTGTRLQLTMELALLWTLSALIASQISIEAVALGCTIVTLLYLPRLLHLYLSPIGATALQFLRTLIAPTLMALAVFGAHHLLMGWLQLDAWPEIGFAVLETLVAYALLGLFGRKVVREKLRLAAEIFES